MFQLFRKNSSATLASLRQAIESQNPEAVKQISHKLKGMSSNLGAQKLANLLKQFELESSNLEKLQNSFSELELVYQKSLEWLDWVDQNPKDIEPN